MNKWAVVKVKQELVDQVEKEVDKNTYKKSEKPHNWHAQKSLE